MQYLIDFILLGIIYFLFFRRRFNAMPKGRRLICRLTYLYICLVLAVTIMPFAVPSGSTNNLFYMSANLIPFRDVIYNYGDAKRQVILNIIMMVPFGFLLPILKKRGFLCVSAWTFLFSLAIESTQLLYVYIGSFNGRTFDVTDLITNLAGGMAGYIIFLLFRPAIKHLKLNKR